MSSFTKVSVRLATAQDISLIKKAYLSSKLPQAFIRPAPSLDAKIAKSSQRRELEQAGARILGRKVDISHLSDAGIKRAILQFKLGEKFNQSHLTEAFIDGAYKIACSG